MTPTCKAATTGRATGRIGRSLLPFAGHESHDRRFARWNRIVGPGILIAAAAIGASHLVQSSRAGADFGFQLAWLIVLVNLLKYPFFEFGPRYAAATGETVLHGYLRLGRGYLITFLIVSIAAMLLSLTALIYITGVLGAFLLMQLLPDAAFVQAITGVGNNLYWCIAVVIACNAVLFFGRYNALDRVTKVIVAILGVCTLIAVAAAFINPVAQAADFTPMAIDLTDLVTVGFLLALMGWMPAPIELSVWPSVWIAERAEQTGFRPTMRQALVDLNIGYVATVVLALAFLSLGALMMYPTGRTFPEAGVAFSGALVGMFAESIGYWITPIIALAAFTCMFSTTLTCLDGYPRSNAFAASLCIKRLAGRSNRVFWFFNIFTIAAALVFIATLVRHLVAVLDVVTIIAFLTAPVFAFLNFRLVMSRHMPREHRPGVVLIVLAWAGFIFLTSVSVAFLYWQIRTWVGG